MAVQKGLNLGVIFFIVSEALFFVAIFWAFFHSALTPTVELGAQWPPMGIERVPYEGVSGWGYCPILLIYLAQLDISYYVSPDCTPNKMHVLDSRMRRC